MGVSNHMAIQAFQLRDAMRCTDVRSGRCMSESEPRDDVWRARRIAKPDQSLLCS